MYSVGVAQLEERPFWGREDFTGSSPVICITNLILVTYKDIDLI